ncbi:MAG TPA: hypothetical protein VJ912_04350 [Candidatus Nanoarchaeia archaeon]|nr:hypothetical protein [Candidatus Nanoarchaeia archaeon]
MGNLKRNKKRGFLFLISTLVSIFTLSSIKAYMGSIGYFGGFSSEDVFLLVAFVIIFFIINLAFSRFFKDSQGKPLKSAWVPALALSLGATYGLWKINFNLGDLLSNIGIPTDFLNIIAPILLIGFLIFLVKKWGFSNILFIFGGGLVLLGLFELIYQDIWVIVIGIILIIIGIIIKVSKGNEEDSDYKPGAFEKGSKKGKTTLQIVSRGRGKTKPKQGIYYYKKPKKVKLKAIPEEGFGFNYWRIDGKAYKKKTVKIKMDRGHYAAAVFGRSREPEKGTPEPEKQKRDKLLIKEAKRYKKKSQDPKSSYDGSWAKFIRYLRKRRIGKNENDICKRLNLSQKEFLNIFNRYGRLK